MSSSSLNLARTQALQHPAHAAFGVASFCRATLLTLLMLTASTAMATEEPAFELIEKQQDFEIREYRPMIVAETQVDGDLDAASRQGFKLLAAYIFGENRSATAAAEGKQDKEKIAMTAPVTVEPGGKRGEPIAMTAPVTAEPTGSYTQSGPWRIQFVMPSRYTMATLPKPVDARVSLREVPVTRFGVLTFSGLAGASKVQQKSAELLDRLRKRGLEPAGPVRLARYNPPWTLPFLRRNEVMVEIVPIAAESGK